VRRTQAGRALRRGKTARSIAVLLVAVSVTSCAPFEPTATEVEGCFRQNEHSLDTAARKLAARFPEGKALRPVSAPGSGTVVFKSVSGEAVDCVGSMNEDECRALLSLARLASNDGWIWASRGCVDVYIFRYGFPFANSTRAGLFWSGDGDLSQYCVDTRESVGGEAGGENPGDETIRLGHGWTYYRRTH
jgi:hypothetical protein